MEITPNIIATPVFRDVTLAMSPREVYLLALVLGGLTESHVKQCLSSYPVVPPRCGVPKVALGPLTEEDMVFLDTFYKNVMDMLLSANTSL